MEQPRTCWVCFGRILRDEPYERDVDGCEAHVVCLELLERE